MANVSYTEDDLDRWLENSRQLKRDFEEIERMLKRGAAQQAEERIKAITSVAKKLSRNLDELEAAATHPWVSAAHRSLMEKIRADEWREKSEALTKFLSERELEFQKDKELKVSKIRELQNEKASLNNRIRDLEKENSVFRDPTLMYGGKVKPLK